MQKHGLDYHNIRSRPIQKEDFAWADLIIGMDKQNIWNLKQMAPASDQYKIKLCLSILPNQKNQDIPDPWYDHRFDKTYEQLKKSLPKWLEYIEDHFLANNS